MRKINLVNLFRKRYGKIIGVTAVCLIVLFGYLYFDEHQVIPNNQEDYAATSEIALDESLEAIERRLPVIIKKQGIDTAIEWVHRAFLAENINMFECHTLSHLIGHGSLDYYEWDFNKTLNNKTLDRCEGGYMHGAEAQIVEDGGDYRLGLFKFCKILQNLKNAGPCFHGAGHAFMKFDATPEKVLELCDKLTGGPAGENVEPCYAGVFSEFTNLVGGKDGHTGLPLADGLSVKLETTPMHFCASLQTQYQIACALELSGYGFSPETNLETMHELMRACVDRDFSVSLEEACLTSTAAVSTQHNLPNTAIIPPDFIYNLPLSLKQAYMKGVSIEMNAFIYNGQKKDWQLFCNSFPMTDDKSFCVKLFETK